MREKTRNLLFLFSIFCLSFFIPNLTKANGSYSVYIYNKSKTKNLYYVMDGLTGYVKPNQMIQFINKSNIVLSYQWYLDQKFYCNEKNHLTHFCFKPNSTVYIGCQHGGTCHYIKEVIPVWN